MGLSGVLDIAKSAINAQRLALEVASENITNVNTPGYSRQTAVLTTAPVSLSSGFPIGRGVNVEVIQRAYDGFIQAQLETENSNFGHFDSMRSAMQRVEQVFNEFTTEGLGESISDFFNAWQDLSMNPQGQPERQSVISRAQIMTEGFHRLNRFLNDVEDTANQNLESIVTDINDKLTQIASLNGQIKQMEISYAGQANELRDKRDLLIRELSGKVGINVMNNADGTVNISLVRGQPLVDGFKASTLSLGGVAGGNDILLTPGGSDATVDVTTIIGGPDNALGEIGGTLKVRDTLVRSFLDDLDELAYRMATEVNALHSAGYDLNGDTGNDFFAPPPALVPPATFVAGFSGVGGINVAVENADDVAASSLDPSLPANSDGNNIQALAIADLKDMTFAMTGATTTFQEFYNSLVGKVGVAVQNAERGAEQSDSLLKQLDTMRESTVGVSLDEELANIIKYQKAFQGAAKLVSVSGEMLDTMLQMI